MEGKETDACDDLILEVEIGGARRGGKRRLRLDHAVRQLSNFIGLDLNSAGGAT